ncbi:unnamed protein product [Natator depressus]
MLVPALEELISLNSRISILRDNNRMCLGEESQGGEFLIEFRTCKLRVRSPVDISRF